jgi:hypothetical protein
MRLLTLCPGLLANDGLCACVLLKIAYRAPAGDPNSRQFSTEIECRHRTLQRWREFSLITHHRGDVDRVASRGRMPVARIPFITARASATSDTTCALRNVFHVTSSGCTPAARISWSHPLPRPRNVTQVRVRLERRGPRHLVRLHASPPPTSNRRVIMPRGDVRLAIWLLKVGTRRVFDSDTRSSGSHWQVRVRDPCLQRT